MCTRTADKFKNSTDTKKTRFKRNGFNTIKS